MWFESRGHDGVSSFLRGLISWLWRVVWWVGPAMVMEEVVSWIARGEEKVVACRWMWCAWRRWWHGQSVVLPCPHRWSYGDCSMIHSLLRSRLVSARVQIRRADHLASADRAQSCHHCVATTEVYCGSDLLSLLASSPWPRSAWTPWKASRKYFGKLLRLIDPKLSALKAPCIGGTRAVESVLPGVMSSKLVITKVVRYFSVGGRVVHGLGAASVDQQDLTYDALCGLSGM